MMFPISKVKFVFHKSADLPSFFKLLINSRRLRRHKLLNRPVGTDPTEKYNLRIGGSNLPVYMRGFSGDIDIFYEVFYKNIYKLDVDPKAVQMILDLGANIGLASLYFSENYPGAKIIAVEPDWSNFLLLQKNMKKLSIENKVINLQAAVADYDGTIGFNSAIRKYNSKIAVDNQEGYEVPAVTLKTMIDEYQIESIDILKIDIEGAESLLFSGDLPWLEIVKNIIVEFHDEEEKARILDILQNREFIARRSEGMLYNLSKRG